MRWNAYVRSLIGRVFKLLPMREDTDVGIENHLDICLADLADELTGSYDTFPELYEKPKYVMVVSTLNALRYNWVDLPFSAYRHNILKMTNALAGILEEAESG